MTFDTTVVHVVIPDLAATFTVESSGGQIDFRFALITANNGMDVADFTQLFLSSIGPSWLYVGGAHIDSVINAKIVLNFTSSGPIHVRAKRRFKENNETLWMLVQNVVEGGTTLADTHWSGMTRTLLHIP